MLHNFKNKNYYLSNLDEEVCNQSLNFIEKIQHHFTQKTWECEIRTSFNKTYNILNCIELHGLKMNILSHIDNFMHSRQYVLDGYIEDSWVNIYEKNFYQEYHCHAHPTKKFICGVIYLTQNNSPIILSPNITAHDDNKVIPKFGNIILFNDDVPHRVIPNNNEEIRISLAFNFVLKKEWGGIQI
jgi:hypothetical protein